MRSLLLLLIASACWGQYVAVPFTAPAAPAGLSFVAAVQNSGSCAGNTVAAPSLNTQSGDTLIIGMAINSTANTIIAPTTNDSETATIIGSALQNAYGADYWLASYAVLNTTADAAKIVTGNLSTGHSCGIVVLQFRGSSTHTMDITSAVNAGAYNGAGGVAICVPSTSATPGTCNSTFTPGTAGEAAILFGLLFTGNGDSYSAGTICGVGATLPTNGQTSDSFQRMAGEYALNIGTSACTGTMNIGPAGFRPTAMVVTLKP